jgi:hypothetical protein
MPSGAYPSTTSVLTSVPLGFNAKAYRYVSSAYAELKNVSDLTVNNSAATVKIPRKGDNGATFELPAQIERSISFTLRDIRLAEVDSQDVFAISAAFELRTTVNMLFLDGTKTTDNAFGWAGDWFVTQFNRAEQDNGDVNFSVTCVPAPSASNAVRAVWVDGTTLTDLSA